MKVMRFIAVLPSIILFVAQITFFVKMNEIIVYGIMGGLWYSLLLTKSIVRGGTSIILVMNVSLFSALALGFVPHRLRPLELLDLHMLMFPAVHFLSIAAFCLIMRTDRFERA